MPALVPPSHVLFSFGPGRGWPGNRRAKATPSFGRLSPAMTRNESALSTREGACEHFFQDLAADVLVGEGSVVPPPAVPLHLLGRGNEAVGDRGKVSVRVVQAEDQPARPDP